MGEVLERSQLMTLFAEARRIQDALQSFDYRSCSEDEGVFALRANEQLRRSAETVDHALIVNAEQLGLPALAGSRTTGNWLRQTLMIDIHEANARVRAAQAGGPRRSLLGEPLEAAYPVVAAAQASGGVAAKQARVITTMLDKLPAAVCEEIPVVEARLVGFAATLDAAQLAQAAERERAWLDPDGGYRDVERRRRDRGCRFTQRPDGSCAGSYEGTAELGEYLQVIRDSLGAPTPESSGIKDPRSAGQRLHDAVLDAFKVAVGAGSLPSAGGMLATVVLTMTEDAYRTGVGFATTGHGAQIPVREALSGVGGLSCRSALVSPSSFEPAGR